MNNQIFQILNKIKIDNDASFIFWIYKIEQINISSRKFLKIYLFNRKFDNKKLDCVNFIVDGKEYTSNSFSVVSDFHNQNIVGTSIEISTNDNCDTVVINFESVSGIPYNKSNDIVSDYDALTENNISYLKTKFINYSDKLVYLPSFHNTYWRCSCGRIYNHNEEDTCFCGLSKEFNKELIEFDIESSKIIDFIEKKEYNLDITFEQNIEEFKKNFENQEDIDSDKLISKMDLVEEEKKYQNLISEKNLRKKRGKKITLISIISLFVLMLIGTIIYLAVTFFIPEYKYNKACKMLSNGQFEEAIISFAALDYKDSDSMINQARFDYACYLLENKEYSNAYDLLSKMNVKKFEQYDEIHDEICYCYAKELFEQKKYQEAWDITNEFLHYYEGLPDLKSNIGYSYAKMLYENNQFQDAYKWIVRISNNGRYDDYDELFNEICYQNAKAQLENKEYRESIVVLERIKDYKDSKSLINEAKYKYVVDHKNRTDDVYSYLSELKLIGYKDSASIYKELYSWHLKVYPVYSENSTYEVSSFDKYDNFYFRFEVSGGVPDESCTVSYKFVFPNGGAVNGKFDYQFIDGSHGVSWGYYSGDTSLYRATGTFTVYAYINGSLMDSCSVQITN